MIRVAALALASLFWAAAAWATVDRWPALYDVTGVAANDVLNIRGGPGADHEVIGSLAHDATDVEVIEADPALAWGRVNTAEGSGWVSLAYLARQPGQWYGEPPELRHCTGTEPFWSLAFDGDSVTLSAPDTDDVTLTRTVTSGSVNNPGHSGSAYAHPLGGMFTDVRLEACSDGMSDRRYGIAIDFLISLAGEGNARMYSGCCSLAE